MAIPSLPEDATAYSASPIFDNASIPDKLMSTHRTKPGVWGRLEVIEGRLDYVVDTEGGERRTLVPGTDGVIEPDVPHHVELETPVRFRIHFMKRPEPGASAGETA